MFGNFGKARLIMPLVIALFMACMMSFMFYPMANMEIKGMSFAILSLDEGVDAGGTTMNVGDTIVESMVSSTESDDDEESTIVWTEVDSQEELDEALENGEYYGALIIPADYSEKQLAATQAETQEMLEEAQALLAAQAQAAAAATMGTDASASGATATDATAATSDTSALAAGTSTDATTEETETEEVEGPVLTMVLDNAKSPMIATQMSTSISSMFQEMGMDVEVETIHTGSTSDDDDDSSTTTSAMSGMMSLMLGVMPAFMLSMMASNFISMGFRTKPGAPRSERWKALGKQVAYAFGLSFLIGLLACFMMWLVAGISVPMGAYLPFIWLTSFCMMMVFLGLANIALPLGMLGGMVMMMFGMMTGTLPVECLPSFWQDWIYPWAPQHYISEGICAILYMDAGVWNAGTGAIIIWGVVGIVLICLSSLIPHKARRDMQEASGSQDKPGSQDTRDSQEAPASTEAATTTA